MPTIATFLETVARWCRRMRPIPSGAISPVRPTPAAHSAATAIPAMGVRLGALLCVLAGPVQAQLCVSDCNGDGVVNVNELVASVRIALDVQPATQCRTAEANGDHVVTIDELVRGVGKALGGCVWNRAFLRDEQGRALVLHGANVSNSAKSDPERLPFVTRDDVMRLSRDFGFNLARYLILWDALEPAPGVYSDEYLDRIAERMEWFREAGVFVVFDMHQDVYARRFCCDGAPEWAIRDDGQCHAPQASWFLNYFTPAAIRAFDNFFAYEEPNRDLQDHYAEAWRRIAARFKGHPAVLGYDLMNEPFPGSYFSVSEAIGRVLPPDADGPSRVPGQAQGDGSGDACEPVVVEGSTPRFDRTLFHAFYERMIAAIRAVDPDGWIFYEPRYGAPAAGMPSYLPVIDDPRDGADRLAYFPHLYSITLEAGGAYDPNDPVIPDWARRRREEAMRQPVPLLIGEFGVTDSVGNGQQFLADVLRMAEETTSGWAIWSYDPDGGYGLLNPDRSEKERVNLLVQTYPQRIAGNPLYFAYDRASRMLWLAFAESGVSAPTEIYVPARRFYPDGFDVWVSDPDGTWTQSWDAEREILSVTTAPSAQHHLVVVAPK